MSGKKTFTTAQICKALEETRGAIFLAAKRLGCSSSLIHKRRAQILAIAETIAEARGQMTDHSELKLFEAMMAGKAWAIQLILRTLGKDRGYVERQEVTGKDGLPLQAEKAMTDEQRRTAVLAVLESLGPAYAGSLTARPARADGPPLAGAGPGHEPGRPGPGSVAGEVTALDL